MKSTLMPLLLAAAIVTALASTSNFPSPASATSGLVATTLAEAATSGSIAAFGASASSAVISQGVTGVSNFNIVPQSPPTDHDQYVVLRPDGEYVHDYNVRVAFVSATVDGFVLQCVRPSNMVYAVYRLDGRSTAVPDTIWREVYVVRDGKITLDRIQLPEIHPAVEESLEWGGRDVVIGGK